MTFARVVFLVAGVWGIVVLTPLYFLVDLTGRHYAAPVDYPHFFYGFLSVAMAWQFSFLVIGSSPSRFRPFMVVGMLEKFGHVAGVTILYEVGRLSIPDATAAVPDFILGVLFLVAFTMTPRFQRGGIIPGLREFDVGATVDVDLERALSADDVRYRRMGGHPYSGMPACSPW